MNVLIRTKIIGVAVMMVTWCIAATNAVADDGMVKECREAFRKYQAQRNYKAFAATPIIRGWQSWGYSYSYNQQMEANREALLQCKRAKQRHFGREKIACRLIK